MATKSLVGLFFLIYVTVVASKRCYYYDSYPHRDYIYCYNDCCGTDYYQYCCDESGDAVGAIVGGVVGGVIFLVIVISAIIACCCCCRRQGSAGTVVMAPAVTSTTVIGSHQHMGMYPQSGYANPGYPPIQTTTMAAPSIAAHGSQPPPPYPGQASQHPPAYPGNEESK